MGFSIFDPGCCCTPEPTCIALKDTFTRADSSTIGSGEIDDSTEWVEGSGDWEIVSGELWTEDSNAAISNSDVAYDCCGFKTEFTCRGTQTGDELYLAFSTPSGEYKVLLTFGTDIKVYVGGALKNTITSVAIPANTNATVKVEACRVVVGDSGNVGDHIRLTVNGTLLAIGTTYGADGSNSDPELGTGTLTGEAFFDDITITGYTDADCADDCTCDNGESDCDPCPYVSTFPADVADLYDEVDLTISGMGTCTGLNDTYTLTRNDSATLPGVSGILHAWEITGLSKGDDWNTSKIVLYILDKCTSGTTSDLGVLVGLQGTVFGSPAVVMSAGSTGQGLGANWWEIGDSMGPTAVTCNFLCTCAGATMEATW